MSLTSEGFATACAALVLILAFMLAHARQQRRTEARKQYLRGEQNAEVSRLKADVLEDINCGVQRHA